MTRTVSPNNVVPFDQIDNFYPPISTLPIPLDEIKTLLILDGSVSFTVRYVFDTKDLAGGWDDTFHLAAHEKMFGRYANKYELVSPEFEVISTDGEKTVVEIEFNVADY